MKFYDDEKYSDYDSYDDNYDSYNNFDEKYYKQSYKESYDYNSYNDSYDNDEYGNNYDNDEYNYYGKNKKSYSFDEGEENAEDELDDDSALAKNIDDDLADYFSDARIFSTKKNNDSTKKRAKKIVYKTDDKIIAMINKEKNNGIILFGPYEVNKKQMYQIELDSGDIIEADDKHIIYQ